MKVKIFKSAVAFFFLFFLHGTAIGTRQQGISYNGKGLCDALAFEKLSLKQEMKMNRIISAENLHVSKGIAKPMLCVVVGAN